MTLEPVEIEYAREAEVSPADRTLRVIVGGWGVVYGGGGLLQFALHIALARGWVARPPNMSWSLSPGVGTILLAGALLLRRSPVGVAVLRWAAAASVSLTVAQLAHTMHEIPSYATYWSKPAPATLEALSLLQGTWVPLLVVALTFRLPGGGWLSGLPMAEGGPK